MGFPERSLSSDEQPALTRLLRKIFVDDWIMKLIALIITLTLWFGVSGLRTPTTARLKSVALNLRVSNDVEVTNSPPAEIDIVVSGDKRKVGQLNPRDLVASLDLTEVPAGDRTVQITPDNINLELPSGVKLEAVEPSIIAVKMERLEEREITVKAETSGSPAQGFEVYGIFVVPQKVRVRGPESFIKTLDFVSTEKISVEGRETDFGMRQVPLNIVNPKAKVLDTVVDVQVRIGEKRAERQFMIPVKVEGKSRTATVVLYGPTSLFEGLKVEDLALEVFKNEAGKNELNVTLPEPLRDRVEIRRREVN